MWDARHTFRSRFPPCQCRHFSLFSHRRRQMSDLLHRLKTSGYGTWNGGQLFQSCEWPFFRLPRRWVSGPHCLLKAPLTCAPVSRLCNGVPLSFSASSCCHTLFRGSETMKFGARHAACVSLPAGKRGGTLSPRALLLQPCDGPWYAAHIDSPAEDWPKRSHQQWYMRDFLRTLALLFGVGAVNGGRGPPFNCLLLKTA